MNLEGADWQAGDERGLRLVVMQPRFGPHHIARLKAAASLLGERGASVIGLETAHYESRYAWDVVEGDQGFERHVLFPQQDYLGLTRAAIHSATVGTLGRLRPHVVYVCGWGYTEGRAAILWCKANGVAIVLACDTTKVETSRSWLRSAIKRRILSLCDAAFVSGARSRDYLIELGFDAEAIAEGIDVVDNDYYAGAAAVSIGLPIVPQGRAYWVTVCRFVPEKNLVAAIEAYAQYRRLVSDPWDWVLCGDGPLRTEISDALDRLGLQQNVTLAGFLQIHDLPAYYSRAAAFWLPSVREPWGLVVNEAMACGLPVVVSNAAGCVPDLVEEGGNGWLCDPSSPNDMAQAMVRMHTASPTQRQAMGRRSRQIVAKWDLYRHAEGLWRSGSIALERSGRRPRGICALDRLLLRKL